MLVLFSSTSLLYSHFFASRALRLSHSRSDIKRPSDSDNTDHTTNGISQCPDRPSKDPVGGACVSPLGVVTHLSDDVLLMVFWYLNLRDIITVERGEMYSSN